MVNSSPSTNISKYFYMWNNSHWKLGELLYNQGSKKKKTHKSASKGSLGTRLESISLGQTQRSKKITRVETLPGEGVIQATYSVSQP